MSCKPLTFRNVSFLKYRAVVARIRAQGEISEVGNTGHASGHGFEATWSYDEPTEVLTVTCTKKPALVFESLVADKIRALVESV
jgi:hypothetical protein